MIKEGVVSHEFDEFSIFKEMDLAIFHAKDLLDVLGEQYFISEDERGKIDEEEILERIYFFVGEVNRAVEFFDDKIESDREKGIVWEKGNIEIEEYKEIKKLQGEVNRSGRGNIDSKSDKEHLLIIYDRLEQAVRDLSHKLGEIAERFKN